MFINSSEREERERESDMNMRRNADLFQRAMNRSASGDGHATSHKGRPRSNFDIAVRDMKARENGRRHNEGIPDRPMDGPSTSHLAFNTSRARSPFRSADDASDTYVARRSRGWKSGPDNKANTGWRVGKTSPPTRHQ